MKIESGNSRTGSTLRVHEPGKVYGGTALKAARHFHHVDAGSAILALVDGLGADAEAEVVAVLDEGCRPVGILTRDRLFSLVGKPFGREVLGRMKAFELAEKAELLDSHAGVFAVAAEGFKAYRVLVDGEGRFAGTLSSRDLADFLSRMTQDDIDLAGLIQERLEEGNEEPGDPRLRLEAWSRAAKGVGGDFWFTRRLEDGRFFVALCDVSGKGVAASLVVSMVWGMLLMHDYGRGLVELLSRLNESLVLSFRLERYLTGLFAIIDPITGIVELADMGHSHAFILRSGRVLRLRSRAGNMPLGLESGVEPRVERLTLKPGDRLFAYSDGFLEQEDGAGSEFGEARLASLVLEADGDGLPLRQALPEALDRHRGRVPQQDDMSFLALRWKEA